MTLRKAIPCIVATIAWMMIWSGQARAQLVSWVNPGTSNWNLDNNWSGPFGKFVPEAEVGESANISNGGTAIYTGAPPIGGVILGQATGQSGALVVESSAMSVVAQAGTNGAVVVGQGGTGSLTIESGASVSAVSLTTGGGEPSSIRLVGPSAGLSPSTATFLGNSTLISEITSASFTPLTAAGNVALGGTYKIEFSGGFNPAVGNSWSIIDAGSVSGQFTNVDTSGVPALPMGQQLVVATRPGGLGTLVELRVEQLLILNIERTTGAISIRNAAGGAPVSFDGYTITSPAATLNSATWNSLDDQNVSGWIEANPTNNRISEVKSSGATILNGNGNLPLGNAYAPGTPAFGMPIEDLIFQYTRPDGSLVDGIVNFSGGVQKFNNLILEIDSSGAAQIINDSIHSVAIEGYTITSSDGSLLASNGTWNSLDDQNAADGSWLEANGTAFRLSEVQADGVTTFNTTNGIEIGQIFDVGGSQSGLTFEFLIAGQDDLFAGGVVFRNHSSATPIGSGGTLGDYNDNGVVDAADYVLWRKLLGTSATLDNDPTPGVGPDDYTRWASNFGSGGGSGSGLQAPVPEPSVACLLILSLPALALRGSFRRIPQ